MYIPDKGDIIWLNFEPSAGKEITKRRPAFVIYRKAFNEHTGFAIVAPITSTVRGIRLSRAGRRKNRRGCIDLSDEIAGL